jgi:hypothetical protein
MSGCASNNHTKSRHATRRLLIGRYLSENCAQRVYRELRGVSRCWWQAADCLYDRPWLNSLGLCDTLPGRHFRYQRAAGHGRHAPLRTKADVADSTSIDLHRELQNVAACWIFNARPRCSVRNVASVPRVFEVVQYLSRIHRC